MKNKRKNDRREAASGFLWRFSERILAQGTAFAVSVILARILQPSLYGTIALVTVFTSMLWPRLHKEFTLSL